MSEIAKTFICFQELAGGKCNGWEYCAFVTDKFVEHAVITFTHDGTQFSITLSEDGPNFCGQIFMKDGVAIKKPPAFYTNPHYNDGNEFLEVFEQLLKDIKEGKEFPEY